MDNTWPKLWRLLCLDLPFFLSRRFERSFHDSGARPFSWSPWPCVSLSWRCAGTSLAVLWIVFHHIYIAKVYERNALYYEKYPADVKRVRLVFIQWTGLCLYLLCYQVRDILRHLEKNPITLPNGGTLTVNRFLQLGLDFGMHGE